MSTQELFVTAARRYLCPGRKALSVPQSLDLAAQVSAVDLGLKPAVLYDSNGADADRVQQYLSSLQFSRLVSESLLTLDLNGNVLIVNPAAVRSQAEQLVGCNVALIDVSHSLEKPNIADPLREELKSFTCDFLLLLGELDDAEKPLYVGERAEGWNLCTTFGLLLGYPVSYWFDQTKSFENCLSMTPLSITTASASWQEDGTGQKHRLYSFSVPAALLQETRPHLENWRLRLQERFRLQNILGDLTFSQSTVSLPSVCL